MERIFFMSVLYRMISIFKERSANGYWSIGPIECNRGECKRASRWDVSIDDDITCIGWFLGEMIEIMNNGSPGMTTLIIGNGNRLLRDDGYRLLYIKSDKYVEKDILSIQCHELTLNFFMQNLSFYQFFSGKGPVRVKKNCSFLLFSCWNDCIWSLRYDFRIIF